MTSPIFMSLVNNWANRNLDLTPDQVGFVNIAKNNALFLPGIWYDTRPGDYMYISCLFVQLPGKDFLSITVQ